MCCLTCYICCQIPCSAVDIFLSSALHQDTLQRMRNFILCIITIRHMHLQVLCNPVVSADILIIIILVYVLYVVTFCSINEIQLIRWSTFCYSDDIFQHLLICIRSFLLPFKHLYLNVLIFSHLLELVFSQGLRAKFLKSSELVIFQVLEQELDLREEDSSQGCGRCKSLGAPMGLTGIFLRQVF